MDNINFKYCSFTIILIIFISFFILLISNNCIAKEEKGVHFIGEPSYKVTNTIIKNNKVIGKSYEICVTMHNAGQTKSDILIVNLSDEDGSIKKETFLEPGETQKMTFTWSIVKIKNQRLEILFYPKDLEAVWNEFNSGSISFTIEMSDTDGLPATSTPGFEAILLTFLIVLLLIFKKKSNHKK